MENYKYSSTYIIGSKQDNYELKDFQTIKLNTQELSKFIKEILNTSKNKKIFDIRNDYKYYFEKYDNLYYLYSSNKGSKYRAQDNTKNLNNTIYFYENNGKRYLLQQNFSEQKSQGLAKELIKTENNIFFQQTFNSVHKLEICQLLSRKVHSKLYKTLVHFKDTKKKSEYIVLIDEILNEGLPDQVINGLFLLIASVFYNSYLQDSIYKELQKKKFHHKSIRTHNDVENSIIIGIESKNDIESEILERKDFSKNFESFCFDNCFYMFLKCTVDCLQQKKHTTILNDLFLEKLEKTFFKQKESNTVQNFDTKLGNKKNLNINSGVKFSKNLPQIEPNFNDENFENKNLLFDLTENEFGGIPAINYVFDSFLKLSKTLTKEKSTRTNVIILKLDLEQFIFKYIFKLIYFLKFHLKNHKKNGKEILLNFNQILATECVYAFCCDLNDFKIEKFVNDLELDGLNYINKFFIVSGSDSNIDKLYDQFFFNLGLDDRMLLEKFKQNFYEIAQCYKCFTLNLIEKANETKNSIKYKFLGVFTANEKELENQNSNEQNYVVFNYDSYFRTNNNQSYKDELLDKFFEFIDFIKSFEIIEILKNNDENMIIESQDRVDQNDSSTKNNNKKLTNSKPQPIETKNKTKKFKEQVISSTSVKKLSDKNIIADEKNCLKVLKPAKTQAFSAININTNNSSNIQIKKKNKATYFKTPSFNPTTKSDPNTIVKEKSILNQSEFVSEEKAKEIIILPESSSNKASNMEQDKIKLGPIFDPDQNKTSDHEKKSKEIDLLVAVQKEKLKSEEIKKIESKDILKTESEAIIEIEPKSIIKKELGNGRFLKSENSKKKEIDLIIKKESEDIKVNGSKDTKVLEPERVFKVDTDDKKETGTKPKIFNQILNTGHSTKISFRKRQPFEKMKDDDTELAKKYQLKPSRTHKTKQPRPENVNVQNSSRKNALVFRSSHNLNMTNVTGPRACTFTLNNTQNPNPKNQTVFESQIFCRQSSTIETDLSQDKQLTSKFVNQVKLNYSFEYDNKTQKNFSYAQVLKKSSNNHQNEAVNVYQNSDLTIKDETINEIQNLSTNTSGLIQTEDIENFDSNIKDIKEFIFLQDSILNLSGEIQTEYTENSDLTSKDENASINLQKLLANTSVEIETEYTENIDLISKDKNALINLQDSILNLGNATQTEYTKNSDSKLKDENVLIKTNLNDDLEAKSKSVDAEEITGIVATEKEINIDKNHSGTKYFDLQNKKELDKSTKIIDYDLCQTLNSEIEKSRVQQFADSDIQQDKKNFENVFDYHNVFKNFPNMVYYSLNGQYNVHNERYFQEYIKQTSIYENENPNRVNTQYMCSNEGDHISSQVLYYEYIPMYIDVNNELNILYNVDPLYLDYLKFGTHNHFYHSQITNDNYFRIKVIQSYEHVKKNINKFSKIITDLLSEEKLKEGEIASSKPVKFTKEGLLNFYSKNPGPEISNIFLTKNEVKYVNGIKKYTIKSYYDNNFKIYNIKNRETLEKLQLNNEAEDVFFILEYKNSDQCDYKLHFEAIDSNNLINPNLFSDDLKNFYLNQNDDLIKEGLYITRNGFFKKEELKTLIYCDLNYRKFKTERYILTDVGIPENAKIEDDNTITMLWNRYYICNNVVKIYEILDFDKICSEIPEADKTSSFVLISFRYADYNIKFNFSFVKLPKEYVQIDEDLQFLKGPDSVLHVTFRTL
ncbi:hypothetical protein GVAV_000105 [Gurleya vavrai]